ncbi:MAG: hypothetical protein K2X66_14950 [Cyanobacteria bacterium]|nr:hypothetical protein [Cyanobacteriota bacterium]
MIWQMAGLGYSEDSCPEIKMLPIGTTSPLEATPSESAIHDLSWQENKVESPSVKNLEEAPHSSKSDMAKSDLGILKSKGSWSTETARSFLFLDAKHLLDTRIFEAKDPQFIDNQNLILQGKTKLNNRTVLPSAEGFYSVKNGEGPTLYYSSKGNLKAIELNEISNNGIIKSYKYLYGSYAEKLGLNSGQLLFASVMVGPGEQYVFETTGNLHAHWVNGTCYRNDGSKCFQKRF